MSKVRTGFKRKYPVPIPGEIFGELTVLGIERIRYGTQNHGMVRVQCSCGAESHLVYEANIRKGNSTRCNKCAKKQSNCSKRKQWGYTDIVPDDSYRRRLLNRINACINRCHKSDHRQFHHYGGRGIHVFEPWRKDHRVFLAYIITLEGWDVSLLELDRIDVNKGYEPGNLRFITKAGNNANKRKVGTIQQQILDLEARVQHLESKLQELLLS